MTNRKRTIRIKTLLLQQELTQIGMAHDLDIAESDLSKIINGYREPSDELKQKLSSYLNTEVGVLFPLDEDHEKEQ